MGWRCRLAGCRRVPELRAQAYPVKPVRVARPVAPRRSNDIVGRVLAQRLSENLGQQFVVENRAGAASIIGTELVAKSAPDGYTVLVNSATHVANALLYRKLPYDPLKDFIGVTALAQAGRYSRACIRRCRRRTVKELDRARARAAGRGHLRLHRQRQLHAPRAWRSSTR